MKHLVLGLWLTLWVSMLAWSQAPSPGRWRNGQGLGVFHCGGGSFAPNNCTLGRADGTGMNLNIGDPGTRGNQLTHTFTFATPIGQSFLNIYATGANAAGSTVFGGGNATLAALAGTSPSNSLATIQGDGGTTGSAQLILSHNNLSNDFVILANVLNSGTTVMDLEAHDLAIDSASVQKDKIQGTTGIFTAYNSIIGDANQHGFGFFGWSASATAQSANLSAQAFSPAITSATAGRYRFCATTEETRAASGGTPSSTLGFGFVTYTSAVDSVVKNLNTTTLTFTNNVTSLAIGGCVILNVKAATGITWSTSSYASAGTTSMQYDVYVTLEYL